MGNNIEMFTTKARYVISTEKKDKRKIKLHKLSYDVLEHEKILDKITMTKPLD